MWSSQSKSAAGRLILGVNCAYHESAAALLRDGEVVFAIEEERLTRRKHEWRPDGNRLRERGGLQVVLEYPSYALV